VICDSEQYFTVMLQCFYAASFTLNMKYYIFKRFYAHCIVILCEFFIIQLLTCCKTALNIIVLRSVDTLINKRIYVCVCVLS